MRVKITDVAKAAKVSPATVSKVFNPQGSNSIKISEETRQRVLAAARSLDYTPNCGAKMLRSGKAQTIGFVVEGDEKTEGFLGEYTVELLNGVRDEAAKRGYHVLLVNDCEYQAHFDCGRIDALAIVGYNRDWNPNEAKLLAEYEGLLKAGRPFVVLNGNYASRGFPCVSVDNEGGMRQAVELVARKGYKRVGFIGDLGENIQTHHSLRAASLKRLLSERGLPVDERFFLCGSASAGGAFRPRTGRYVFDDGYEGMRILVERGLETDCLAFGGDNIAFGAMKFCSENGISIPGRIAMIGFDDVPSAELSSPALTSVVQPLREMGRSAFKMLWEGIEAGRCVARSESAGTVLVERAST